MPHPKQQWIGATSDSFAPLFRHEFSAENSIEKAVLCVSGLGYHEAWINGERVGDHVLDPAQTDYEHRVFYVTHDVTTMVQNGSNAIGVVLGNGWYNQDRVWGPKGLSYGQPRLMAELHLTYKKEPTTPDTRHSSASDEVIRADSSWRWTPGPITDNNIYAGECYDSRLEIDGWCELGFDDSNWEQAVALPTPGGKFEEQTMPPMRRVEELSPVAIAEKTGGAVVDFGQNFSGWVRIRIEAAPGTEIIMRFAETIFPDGSIDTASTGVFATHVEQIDRYTCKGGGLEVWEPRFTYHGFRYVEVTDWPGKLTADDITGVVVHTDVASAGSFDCSDDRLNKLHNMALWTHRSNMHGLPEDCPVRERCGWLGDANLVAEYSLWNYDAKSFWEKFLGDIETTRAGNNGIPCDIAPGKRGTGGNANPDWAAAFIMVPWYLYQFSGDTVVLESHWQGMTQLMDHFEAKAEGWILRHGYGDFFDPGTDAIVMHTPQVLSTTLWFCHCATVMASMADALGDAGSAETYRDWSTRIARAVKERFYSQEKGSFGSQGANALALAFNVLPDEDSRIMTALVADIRERDTHMNVGVMGVRFILEVLTRRGQGDLALELMHQNSYPSFGHLIERGATTLWECWGEDGHNGTHGARSLSHPFMGGYDNWFYNTLAGIRIDPENPGFKHVFLEPHPVADLEWVRCHYDCHFGRVESNWNIENGAFVWDIVIPEGTHATVRFPHGNKTLELTAGAHSFRESL